MGRETRVLVEGLCFGEGPRWRDGRLWFSDMHAHRVMTVDAEGKTEAICTVREQPSGLGWLPDGTLLVVSMVDRRLLRLDDGVLSEVADLSGLAPFHCNDMVVDGAGRAYIGNFGAEIGADATGPPPPTCLVLVPPNGPPRVVAEDLHFPNGTVITPDGSTLVVGETFGQRLTAFDIQPDGSLAGRRVWADVPGKTPDGICLDAENAIWITSPITGEICRVREGGEIAEIWKPQRMPFACMLGGEDGRTLHVLTADTFEPEKAVELRSGQIETAEVEVPGAGWP